MASFKPPIWRLAFPDYGGQTVNSSACVPPQADENQKFQMLMRALLDRDVSFTDREKKPTRLRSKRLTMEI
jgi:hypothetical protein